MATVTVDGSGWYDSYANVPNSTDRVTNFYDLSTRPNSLDVRSSALGIVVKIDRLPPGEYSRVVLPFSFKPYNYSKITDFNCYLIDEDVLVGTDEAELRQIAIESNIHPTEDSTYNEWTQGRIVFENFSTDFRQREGIRPLYVYIRRVGSGGWVNVNPDNYAPTISTSADNTPPEILSNSTDAATYDYDGIVNFSWLYSQTPADSTEITTTLEYSNDGGENWTQYRSAKDADTGMSAYASRFGIGRIDWRVRGYTYFALPGQYATGYFTVKAPLSTATPVSPVSGYRDRKSTIELTWTAGNVVPGYTPDKTDIQWKTESGSWTNLTTVTNEGRNYTVPANTFPHEVIYWRVRAYNQDDLPGDWSSEASFTTVDATTYAVAQGPINGASVNETTQIRFIWGIQNSYHNRQKAALLEYMEEGGSWAELTTVDGPDQYYYAPANFFHGDNYSWRVYAYNQDDVIGPYSVGTFTTLDKPQIATAIVPKDTVEDADLPILFRWNTSSSSGEASRGADLQYSLDNEVWVNLGPAVESGPQIVGNVHEYEVPGDALPPGVIFWHVRSYNRNGYAGEWSEAVSFVARAAPTMQDIGISDKPWATVNWQSDDQLSYEVFIDGESLGSFFGGERQYQLPDYLSDGDHTVGVRVLGSFSLWSQILETQVHIENSPVLQLVLKAMTDIDTELVWTGGAGDFFIYRDGLMIGHTNEHSFVDRTAVGVHDYLVIERLASGNYNASAVLTRTPSVDCQHIAALAGGEWIAIPHTLKSQSDPAYSESQEVEYNYLAGSDYPTASIGSQREDSGSYSAVFLYTEQDEHKRFLALRGKPVIFKTADGEVMIGILNAWERKPKLSRNKKYYTAYTFSIQRVGWGDFIDDTV